jgi:hypothetical protein
MVFCCCVPTRKARRNAGCQCYSVDGVHGGCQAALVALPACVARTHTTRPPCRFVLKNVLDAKPMAALPASKAGATKDTAPSSATDVEAGPAIVQIIPPRPPKETLTGAADPEQGSKPDLEVTSDKRITDAESPTIPESSLPCMASPVDAWGSALRRMYAGAAASPLLVQVLSALLLGPLLSISINIMSAIMGFWLLVAVGTGGERNHSWAFMNTVDVRKCCGLRALLVVLIEAPASIAFVTWAYLTPYKNSVGVFVYSTVFLLSISFSMVHIVFEMWHLKNELLETASLSALFRYKLDLAVKPVPKARANVASKDGVDKDVMVKA